MTNLLIDAAAESGPAHENDRLRAIHRHARISRERAAVFWDKCSGSPASPATGWTAS